MANKTFQELLEQWTKVAGQEVRLFENPYNQVGVLYQIGPLTDGEHSGFLPRSSIVPPTGKSCRIAFPYMSVTVQQFPSCCGMNIMNSFFCSNKFTKDHYWDFLQLTLSKDINPAIGIISNVEGYERSISNLAISENAQLLQKTHNGNYGSCISTYMIYPERHGDYFTTRLDEVVNHLKR